MLLFLLSSFAIVICCSRLHSFFGGRTHTFLETTTMPGKKAKSKAKAKLTPPPDHRAMPQVERAMPQVHIGRAARMAQTDEDYLRGKELGSRLLAGWKMHTHFRFHWSAAKTHKILEKEDLIIIIFLLMILTNPLLLQKLVEVRT